MTILERLAGQIGNIIDVWDKADKQITVKLIEIGSDYIAIIWENAPDPTELYLIPVTSINRIEIKE